MTLRPDPFTEIREALTVAASFLPIFAAPGTRLNRAVNANEAIEAARITLSRLEREAAERETAHYDALLQAERDALAETEALAARVREVEAERDRLKDATSGLANAAESFIHSFSGHIGESYFTADTLTRSIARARAVLAAALPAVDAPPEPTT